MQWSRRLLLISSLFISQASSASTKFDDQIVDLPWVTFEVPFKQYSGYLDGPPGTHLHYWLVESQLSPSTAPLILVLGGDGGCSSLSGLLSSSGPFRPSHTEPFVKGGTVLEENVHSWNKVASLLYLESPHDVGYSYRDTDNGDDYDDDQTAKDTVLALKQFLARFPEYIGREFYIMGETAADVSVLPLALALIREIKGGSLSLNLKGLAIGNGELSEDDQFNSAMNLAFWRGLVDKEQFESLYPCCHRLDPMAQFINCRFRDLLRYNGTDPAMQKCASDIVNFDISPSANSRYNTYQDCYALRKTPPDSISNGEFVDQASLLNSDSTDALNGFPCYALESTTVYLRLEEVRTALHVPYAAPIWQYCSNDINNAFRHNFSTAVVDSILNSGLDLKLLFFNGDAGLGRNFLGTQWFVERMAERNGMAVAMERKEWTYTRANGSAPRGGGYAKQWKRDSVTVDLLTVKGAGEFVSMDRPGPVLQIINNFLFGNNYSHSTGISLVPAPIKREYQAPSPPRRTVPSLDVNGVVSPVSRKEADRVFDLPGLTFNYDASMYAGYLKTTPGNYLHYWFLESQRSPANDPLILWLTGGPGCSGYSALLTENGPFHPNRDGDTLYENAFAWNKIANVLYIESPRGVGFSYQNTSENTDDKWDDTRASSSPPHNHLHSIQSATDVYMALRDFLVVFPEFLGRPFYITGESYAGIYIPTTAGLLIDKITDGSLSGLNFLGFAIGNGQLSGLQQINAAIQMMYWHGSYGKEEWLSLAECCPQSLHPGDPAYFEFCDYTPFVYINASGKVTPKDPNNACSVRVAEIAQQRVFHGPQSVYNVYQGCYEKSKLGTAKPNLKKPVYAKKGFVDQALLVSHESSDGQDGFPCWGRAASELYMSLPEVHTALHARVSENFTWTTCSHDKVPYNWTTPDTTEYWDRMIQKGYPLRVLIYNGDVDNACNFLADQWFIEKLEERHGLKQPKEREAWRYQEMLAGYTQRFVGVNITIDLLTGSGHFVPMDRPGPALQMLSAFLDQQPYSKPIPLDMDLARLTERFWVQETVGQEDLNSRAKRETEKESSNKKTKTRPPPPPQGSRESDRVVGGLPGTTFDLPVAQFSGYFNPAPGHYIHYYLVEAELDPTNKPLILWLNGGPGCSSMTGLVQELGPALTNRDGTTLYENVFSWHKIGNLLFLDSPRDVGFSFTASDAPSDENVYSDEETAHDNVHSLIQFFDRFPEYKGRKFYITGESYAGVYIPTLTDGLLNAMRDGTIPRGTMDLQGIVLVNALISLYDQVNSAIALTYFKGFKSKEQFDRMKECAVNSTGPMAYYDWARTYFNKDTPFDVYGHPIPASTNTSTLEGRCAMEVIQQGPVAVWNAGFHTVYNPYEDCYVSRRPPPPSWNDAISEKRMKRDIRPLKYANPFVDEAKRMNYASTDGNEGYYCYEGQTPYLNRPEVRKAMHIPDSVAPWYPCTGDSPVLSQSAEYRESHFDTTPTFENILSSVKALDQKLRLLILNGDADMACQFMGNQWFMEDFAAKRSMTKVKHFSDWFYFTEDWQDLGGYVKSWRDGETGVTFDLLTGAGHLDNIDRPGSMLQTMWNFINPADPNGHVDYNSSIPSSAGISTERKPLKAEYYASPSPTTTRRMADRVFTIPGLTFEPSFDSYSGYLKTATDEGYLFYWLVEAHGQDQKSPLVLWLGGDKGCSTLGGLFVENGPFRPNSDGRTLFENVYSWNKAVHVLYIETVRGVGLAWQDASMNNDTVYSDQQTISDLYAALEDFFTAHPMYSKTDLYIAGQSYSGGVLVPLLSKEIITMRLTGRSSIQLKGLIVGNGELSSTQKLRSDPLFLYMHGVIGKSDYDSLRPCCGGSDAETLSGLWCPYDKHFDADFQPIDDCSRRLVALTDLSKNSKWMKLNNIDNLNQDCYGTGHGKSFDPLSTDSQAGFPCYASAKAEKLLNQRSMRSALNVPSEMVQPFEMCNTAIASSYKSQHHDMTATFEMLSSNPGGIRVLLYAGDLSTMGTFMQTRLFVEGLVHEKEYNETSHEPWLYSNQVAGYAKSFSLPGLRIDVLTVKGAGGRVAMDRGGPSLQMIGSFLRGDDYSTPFPYPLQRRPLLEQYSRYYPTTSTSTTSSTTTPSTSPAETSSSPAAPSSASPPPTSTNGAPAICGLLVVFVLATLI